ncbi:MAG: hypothetical protein V7711_13395 [Pseudomonadales bacterium]
MGSCKIYSFVLLLLISPLLHADALIRNNSVAASTIAEIFIEQSVVRVELEIGVQDLPAFGNILPDPLYQKLGLGDQSFAERSKVFFDQELVISAANEPLPGRIIAMEVAQRMQRDIISGQPLPVASADAVDVLRLSLEYPFSGHPEQLALQSQGRVAQASIGFVAYHLGVGINDFRYLGRAALLNLDWQDPWYSAFNNRIMRRQYFSPMSGFLYIEPFEVRKEIIVRPKDLQRWVDLGLEGRETIPVDMQGDIKLKVAEFLAQHQPVTIDGSNEGFILDRVNFLERTLTSSRVIDPPEELSINAAVMGVIFVYPTKTLPNKVTMEWDLWDERIQQVSASAVDQAGPFPQVLDPDWATLEWNNFLQNPEIPTLNVLTPPPPAWLLWVGGHQLILWLITAILILFSIVVFGRRAKRAPAAITAVLGISGIVLAVYAQQRLAADQQKVAGLVSDLLHNVYRAFDYRDESDIYDVLDRSVKGELLSEIYLETQRSLVLANQGGARAKVKSIELGELSAETLADRPGYLASTTWTVRGSVGHWGHIHQRSNQYRGELIIEPIDGEWKLTGMELLEEERL